MKFTEERLVSIFKEVDNKPNPLFFYQVALVEYNLLTKDFVIKYGKLKGQTKKDFNVLEGSPIFMNGYQTIITSGRRKKDKLSIYIFDSASINEIQQVLSVKRVEAYMYISQRCFGVELWPYDIKSWKQVYSAEKNQVASDYAAIYYSAGEIFSQLYGNEENKEEIDNTKDNKDNISQDDNSKMRIYVADPESGRLMEMFKEELLDNDVNNWQAESQDEKENEIVDLVSIIDEVSNKIIGQDEAIKTLVSNIYYNQKLIDSLEKDSQIDEVELDSRKVNILIDGSTGTGKTAIAKAVAAQFNLPIVITNANSFSETGYVGPTITDLLIKLYNQTEGDLSKAERGIIVLDEIDKIAVDREYNHSMKRGVQEELLTFIGGGKYDLGSNVSFDTSKITFILMGAFTDLRDKKIKDNETSKIGFGDDTNKDKSYTLTPEDYIEYGIMREFFGRIKVLASTKSYPKEDLTTILLKSEISPLKNFEKNAKMFGYNGIVYNSEFISKIVDEAYKMQTGARALQTVMSGIQNNLLMDMVTNKAEANKSLELTDEMLESYKKAKIIKY